jgi:hypothetical protein
MPNNHPDLFDSQLYILTPSPLLTRHAQGGYLIRTFVFSFDYALYISYHRAWSFFIAKVYGLHTGIFLFPFFLETLMDSLLHGKH